MRSGQFDIDYAKQVTKLADYSGVAITVSNDYEINDTAKQELCLVNHDMLPSGKTSEIIKNLSLRREHILSWSEKTSASISSEQQSCLSESTISVRNGL